MNTWTIHISHSAFSWELTS